jgi:hypothetical protein
MAIFNTVYGGEWSWKPWTNTLFYYNIDDNDTTSTLYDKTWNLNMTWNAAPTYSTDSKVGRYVHWFSTSVFAKASKYVNFGTEYTMSCLVYFDSSWSWWVLFAQWESSSLLPNKTLEFWDTSVYFRTARSSPQQIDSQSNPWTNKWSVYTFVCSQTWNYRRIYVNGSQIATTTYLNDTTLNGAYPSIWVWSQSTWSSPMQWYMKNLLGENKAWSEDEILNYYNKTKSKYWL